MNLSLDKTYFPMSSGEHHASVRCVDDGNKLITMLTVKYTVESKFCKMPDWGKCREDDFFDKILDVCVVSYSYFPKVSKDIKAKIEQQVWTYLHGFIGKEISC